jgi:hypothetical protein
VNVLSAIKDEHIFKPFLGDDLTSWARWMVALRCLYGLKVEQPKSRALVQECTGRNETELPPEGFSTALFLVGRRSGKSRIASIIGAYEALFGGHETRLAKGETGIVPIISPSRYQSTVVWKYLKAIFNVPLLQHEIVECKESAQTLLLRNGIEIRILSGDWRTVRGPAVVCAILDEVCFFGYTDESTVRSDTELVRALRPALITTKGKLIGISSKYAQRGYAFEQWKRQHGSNKGNPQFNPAWRTLVWDAPSRTMNPTLSQAEIDKEFAEDPAAARSEFGGEWRDDVAEFVPRSLIESLVIARRFELLPRSKIRYFAGGDISGGRRDSAALVIVHREERQIIEDFAKEWAAPFKPLSIVAEMAHELKRFRILSVTGDNYAGDWPVEAFRTLGIHYRPCDAPKNELYRELLPVLCGGREQIELLDNATQTNQFASLERRARSSGKDVIDHPRGAKDDLANALAVAVAGAVTRKRVVGAIPEMLSTLSNFNPHFHNAQPV